MSSIVPDTVLPTVSTAFSTNVSSTMNTTTITVGQWHAITYTVTLDRLVIDLHA